MSKELEGILADFHIAALRTQAANPTDFVLDDFVKEYSSTLVFKLRIIKATEQPIKP